MAQLPCCLRCTFIGALFIFAICCPGSQSDTTADFEALEQGYSAAQQETREFWGGMSPLLEKSGNTTSAHGHHKGLHSAVSAPLMAEYQTMLLLVDQLQSLVEQKLALNFALQASAADKLLHGGAQSAEQLEALIQAKLSAVQKLIRSAMGSNLSDLHAQELETLIDEKLYFKQMLQLLKHRTSNTTATHVSELEKHIETRLQKVQSLMRNFARNTHISLQDEELEGLIELKQRFKSLLNVLSRAYIQSHSMMSREELEEAIKEKMAELEGLKRRAMLHFSSMQLTKEIQSLVESRLLFSNLLQSLKQKRLPHAMQLGTEELQFFMEQKLETIQKSISAFMVSDSSDRFGDLEAFFKETLSDTLQTTTRKREAHHSSRTEDAEELIDGTLSLFQSFIPAQLLSNPAMREMEINTLLNDWFGIREMISNVLEQFKEKGEELEYRVAEGRLASVLANFDVAEEHNSLD